MKTPSNPRRWSGPPLALQITGLLMGGLVVAQLVTLALTLLLPPEPQRQYELGDIARLLSGPTGPMQNTSRLQRVIQQNPPQPTGPGWLTSERSRHDLARLLGREEADIRLFFYTPLPFAGTAGTPPRDGPGGPPPRSQGETSQRESTTVSPLVLVDFQIAQAGGGPGGGTGGGASGGPGGGSGGGPAGGGFGAGPGPAGPSTQGPGNSASPQGTRGGSGAPPGGAPSNTPSTGPPAANAPTTSPSPANVQGNLNNGPGSGPAPGPGSGPGPSPSATPSPQSNQTSGVEQGRNAQAAVSPSASASALAATTTPPTQQTQAASPTSPRDEAPRANVPAAAAAAPPSSPAAQAGPSITSPAAPDRMAQAVPEENPNSTEAPRRWFGFGPAPFVQGDFVAAMYVRDAGWAVVQPASESFPNAWQRRVLLWFVIAAAVVAPAGWWFSRRLVRPLTGFAAAAEQLGRDPTALVLALDGPAEVGRAAQAFNRMQSRLRSFVDDRTAMIGAISHDLRTPLTRMRFRIEDVPDEVRVGMLEDVEEMEAMISSVLGFIRDASEPGMREALDLASIVEDVVEDTVFVGRNATLTHAEKAPVEVDAIGMRRLLGNLVENAVKYGSQARVRLFTEGQDAVVEVSDNGPGLPDIEMERVFQPFYRTAQARASRRKGNGLGLAVCRSIARAHGGDVRLMRGPQGLIAQLRLPLAYGTAAA